MRSLLIVTSLKSKQDIKALNIIKKYNENLDWEPFEELMIDKEVWEYSVKVKNYDPKQIFCHPKLIMDKPKTSLYYRCLSGLSKKAARSYVGSIDSIEIGNPKARLTEEKAQKIARTYNTFICSIIKNSSAWTIKDGYRTVIATLGITLDGVMRNKIGDVAEERIRIIILEWLQENGLISDKKLYKKINSDNIPKQVDLIKGIVMKFSSEPDISFYDSKDMLLAVIEIKGGTDAAGALERYGAATKSFQHAISSSPRCKNFYLAAVFTQELEKRIKEDRLVENTFYIIDVLDKPDYRNNFFREVFHHTLRLT